MIFSAYHRKKRFKHWRDPPTDCNCCGEPLVVLTGNEAVYKLPVGQWPWVYLCMSCGAYCGVHPHSIYPIGTLADRETRALRSALHAMIDPLWKDGHMSRFKVYKMLSRMMRMPDGEEFHIGNLSREECIKAGEVFKDWEMVADFNEPP